MAINFLFAVNEIGDVPIGNYGRTEPKIGVLITHTHDMGGCSALGGAHVQQCLIHCPVKGTNRK